MELSFLTQGRESLNMVGVGRGQGLFFVYWDFFALICGILFLNGTADDVGTGFICLVCACIMFGLGMALFGNARIVKEVPTYKVAIEDSVSMVEFYDRYEILNVQGKIYTIMERED